jgi:imidazoleglycerol-phosphate dehydratase
MINSLWRYKKLRNNSPLNEGRGLMSTSRTATVKRTTKESEVFVQLNLDGTGVIDISTGVPFFEHMLSQLGKHSGFDLTVKTVGDVDVDSHHTVEDTSLAFGQALREALGDKNGIRRFGDAVVPLDEVLVQAAVDLSGRPYLVHRQPEIVELIGTFDTTLGRHIWESIVAEARIALHIRVLEGRNAHHVFEAQFKAVARALRDAVAIDGRSSGIPSTKGVL